MGPADPSCAQAAWGWTLPAAVPCLARPTSTTGRVWCQVEMAEGVLHFLHSLGQVQQRRGKPLPPEICSNHYCRYSHKVPQGGGLELPPRVAVH